MSYDHGALRWHFVNIATQHTANTRKRTQVRGVFFNIIAIVILFERAIHKIVYSYGANFYRDPTFYLPTLLYKFLSITYKRLLFRNSIEGFFGKLVKTAPLLS